MAYHLCMESPRAESAKYWAPRKLSHAEAREEQRRYWGRMSIPERLAAAAELKKRMYRMRGIDLDALEPDWTPRRISRR